MVAIGLGGDQVARYWYHAEQTRMTAHLVQEINSLVIHRINHIAGQLALAPEIRDVCAARSSPDNRELLRVLDTASTVLQPALVYVLDRSGNVLGSSDSSLRGKNYRFRPYFIQAMAGTPAQYGAVGVTTGKRGIYFSEPVVDDDEQTILGVVVIKIGIRAIEFFYRILKKDIEVLLLTPQGIVFSSTRPEWLYQRTRPLSQEEKERLGRERQFPDLPTGALPFSLDSPFIRLEARRALVHRQDMALPGWQLVTIQKAPFPFTVVLGLCGMVVTFSGMYISVLLHSRREQRLRDELLLGRKRSLQAESDRREMLRELETILSASLVGIMLVRSSQIINVNERMGEIFGYSANELLGQDIRIFFPSRKAFRRFVLRFARQLERQALENIECELRRRDGRIITCMLSGKAIVRNDLSSGVVWVVEDITARKLVEAELEQARLQAEEASRAKSEFLANMSHEIRTPMNGIIGLSELVLETDLADQQRKHLKLIHTSALRLMTIIDDILDFSKIEAGRILLDEQPFSLREALAEVMSNLEVQARSKDLLLRTVVEDDVPDRLIGDQSRLMQVIVNLTGNGIKFTDHGSVTVRISRLDDSRSEQVQLHFEIMDTGIGISPEKQDVIFDVFVQGDTSHSRQYGGTGLGLSISRQIVQLMGGELQLQSRVGEGSRFYFSLWFRRAEQEQPSAVRKQVGNQIRHHDQGRHHILLAEDEFINTTLAVSLLEQAGFQVTAVDNGRKAVESWQKGGFDCILMDIQMPEMDGYEAVRRIRQLEEEHGAHIPIIAMTAHAREDDRQKCLESGMDDYIAKPINGTLLLEKIEFQLNG